MNPIIIALTNSLRVAQSQSNNIYVESGASGAGTIEDPIGESQFNALTDLSNKNVYFKKGDTFNEVSLSITSVNNLHISSYGSGNAPKITGAYDISVLSWVEESTNLWYAITDEPKWILLNDVLAKQAETGFVNATNINSTTISTATSYTSSLVGGIGVIQDQPWWTTKGYTISAVSGTQITFSEEIVTSGSVYKVNLMNRKEFISNNNEWAYDSGRIYIQSTVNPNTLNIKAVTKDRFINAISCSNLRISNLNIFGYGINAVKARWCDFMIIDNNEIHENRGIAIHTYGNSLTQTIYSNEIHDNACTAIGYRTIQGLHIYSNNIYNIGTGLNVGYPNDTDDWARNVQGAIHPGYELGIETIPSPDNVLVELNTIDNIAYNGISFAGNSNSIARKNIVSNCLQVFSDGAGIYEFYYTAIGTVIPANRNTIENNIISGIYGVTDTAGIYIDNNCDNSLVQNNVVYDCDNGILVNDITNDINLLTNIIRANSKALWAKEYTTGIIDGMTFTNNVSSVIGSSNSWAFYYQSLLNTAFTSSVNYYFSPYLAYSGYRNGNTDITGLQSYFGTDATSTEKKNWLTYVNEATAKEDLKVYANPTDSPVNQLIPSGYEDVNGNDISGQTIEIPAWYGLLILKS